MFEGAFTGQRGYRRGARVAFPCFSAFSDRETRDNQRGDRISPGLDDPADSALEEAFANRAQCRKVKG